MMHRVKNSSPKCASVCWEISTPSRSQFRVTSTLREDIFRLRADEMLIDCGAFDGDTFDMFA